MQCSSSCERLETEDEFTSVLLKKRRQKKRSVSFSDNIQVVYAEKEKEFSSGSNSPQKDEIIVDDSGFTVSKITEDEGFEDDTDDSSKKSRLIKLNTQAKFKDLSKAELKKLRKNRENKATSKFLNELNIETDIAKCGPSGKCRKRQIEVAGSLESFKPSKAKTYKTMDIVVDDLVDEKEKNDAQKIKEKHQKKKQERRKKRKEARRVDKQVNHLMQSFDVCTISGE